MKIAIITFHGAHNYGAVLQAYALQQYILSLDLECEIINFRSKSQRDFNSLYPRRNGMKSLVKNIAMLPYDSGRRKRNNRFEDFINNMLCLTQDLYETEDNLYLLNSTVDVFISGSDQVWNTTKKADVSNSYFLDFVTADKRKIAYAVSLGNAKKDDILGYVNYMDQFTAISCREERGSKIVSKLLDKTIPVVLDPTLLVNNELFDRLIRNVRLDFKEYIFYYSLDGYDRRNENIEELRAFGKRLHKQVVVLTPEWPKKKEGFFNVLDAGPIEFVALIKNAFLVCTNSFHGMALSISFKKNFYVLEKYDGIDDRKLNVLKQLELENRMIKGRTYIEKMKIQSINYKRLDPVLNSLRKYSSQFLLNALDKD